MTIEETGRNEFHVHTINRRNEKQHYVVDMEGHKGFGSCTCPNWDYVQRPKNGICKHMEAVHAYVKEALLEEYIKNIKKEKHENTNH